MNVCLILSSGKGVRVGADVPKQYLKIKGKEVIAYVIEAAQKAQYIDEIVVVANIKYVDYIKQKYVVNAVEGGAERNQSLKIGLDYIKNNFNCDKLIIADAVRPFVTASLLDTYIKLLDSNDAVITTHAITDSLGCMDAHKVDRSRYYLISSPEAFNFPLLFNHFDSESYLTEVSQQLPYNSTIYKYTDFTNNFKITYKHDLIIAEAIFNQLEE